MMRGLGPAQADRGSLFEGRGTREEIDRVADGHGERSRSQLLLKLAGAENVLILAVNGLAVHVALHALHSVKKCLIHST